MCISCTRCHYNTDCKWLKKKASTNEFSQIDKFYWRCQTVKKKNKKRTIDFLRLYPRKKNSKSMKNKNKMKSLWKNVYTIIEIILFNNYNINNLIILNGNISVWNNNTVPLMNTKIFIVSLCIIYVFIFLVF